MTLKLVKKNNVVRTKFVLNPFIWFSLVWIIVLFVHTFNFTKIYPATSSSMYAFLITIIILSLILAIFYHKYFLKKLNHINISSRPLFSVIVFCYFVLALECIYSKTIPFVSMLRGDITYLSFGMPAVSGLISTLNLFLCVLCSIKLVYCDDNKVKNFIAYLLSCGRFVIVFSRAGLIICAMILFLIFLSKRRWSFWWIPLLAIGAIVFLFVFNILGNIRMGFAWNDSSYFLEVSQFNKNYYNLQNFSWGLVYLDSPLGNLLYNESYAVIGNDSRGLLSQLLPNIISEVLYPEYNRGLLLAIPNLNVSSIFAGGFKYYGYVGMIAIYIEMVAIIYICSLLSEKDPASLLGTAVFLSIMCAMSFFDNIFILAGQSFMLIYLIIYAHFFNGKKKYLNYQIFVCEA